MSVIIDYMGFVSWFFFDVFSMVHLEGWVTFVFKVVTFSRGSWVSIFSLYSLIVEKSCEVYSKTKLASHRLFVGVASFVFKIFPFVLKKVKHLIIYI